MLRKKRWLWVLIALMATMSLVLVGCDTGADEDIDNTPPAVEETEDLEPVEPTEELDDDDEMVDDDDEEAVGDDDMDEMAGGYGGPWVLGERIVDLEIETADGEYIATLTDILFRFDGQIAYVIFDTGEFLDPGQTVAVDWGTLQSQAGSDMATAPVLVYTGDEETLGQEPAIDVAVMEEQDLVVDVAELGLDDDDDRLLQASDFTGFINSDYNLVNQNDEDLGEIEDIILNLQQGTVAYALADVGGFLGIGENTVAVPWEQVNYNADAQNFTMPVMAEDLETAPTVDLDAIEDDGFDDDWDTAHEEYWTGFTPSEPDMDDDEEVVGDDDADEMAGGYGGPWVLGERIVDLEIETADSEYIATLTDILFRFDGQIAYVIFDTGEFLDPGQTVAVDWGTLQSQAGSDMATAPVLVYTGDEETLGQEPAIDVAVMEEQDLVVDVAELGLDDDDDRLLQASDFTGFINSDYNLVNQNDEDLGEIEDIILNLQQGTVAYALADVGGFLGIGENTVAVPWEQVSYNADAQSFTMPVAAEDLEAAPTVDVGVIEDEGFDSDWNAEHDTYWDEFAAGM